MTSIYVLELNDNKYYITEIENDTNNANIIAKIDKIKKLPWVKKHNIKSVRKMIDITKTIKVASIEYIKKFGIENVRSDLIQSETIDPSILAEINSTTYDKMKFSILDKEINMLKNIHDSIVDNNNSLLKYKQLFLEDTEIINKYKRVHELLTTMNKYVTIDFNMLKSGFGEEYTGHITQILKKIKDDSNIIQSNVTPEELESTLKKYFSDFETLEEISNGLVIQKKNEKLISKYGSIKEIKDKLAKLFAEKIVLLQSLNIDDLSETDFQSEDEDDEEEEEEEEEDEDDEDDEDEDDEDEDEDVEDKKKNTVIENDEQYENKLAVIYNDKLKYENIVNQVVESNTKPLEYYVVFVSGNIITTVFSELNKIITTKIKENSKPVGGINIVCNIDGEFTASQALVKPVLN